MISSRCDWGSAWVSVSSGSLVADLGAWCLSEVTVARIAVIALVPVSGSSSAWM